MLSQELQIFTEGPIQGCSRLKDTCIFHKVFKLLINSSTSPASQIFKECLTVLLRNCWNDWYLLNLRYYMSFHICWSSWACKSEKWCETMLTTKLQRVEKECSGHRLILGCRWDHVVGGYSVAYAFLCCSGGISYWSSLIKTIQCE